MDSDINWCVWHCPRCCLAPPGAVNFSPFITLSSLEWQSRRHSDQFISSPCSIGIIYTYTLGPCQESNRKNLITCLGRRFQRKYWESLDWCQQEEIQLSVADLVASTHTLTTPSTLLVNLHSIKACTYCSSTVYTNHMLLLHFFILLLF